MFRDFRRAPAFAVCTIATLALGVGANTGAFSALNSLLLKPLPYPESERLVSLFETALDGKPRDMPEIDLLDWRAGTHRFSAMAAYRPRSFGLTRSDSDSVAVIQTGMVMAEFFHVIEVPPALGRVFTEQEEIGEAPLIVLTDRLWRRYFAANARVLGRKIWLNEEPRTVVGVMPPGFEYPMGRILPDAFIPLSRKDYCCRHAGSVSGVARLQPGVRLEAARMGLQSVSARLARQYPITNSTLRAELEPLQTSMTGSRREPLWLLVTATALLLAIALANITGLILARSLNRVHETAVRVALGAGVWRLARLHFLEAAAWSAAGTAAGWLAAGLVLQIVPRFVPGAIQSGPLRLDGAAFACAAALAIVATLVLGGAPTMLALGMDQNSLLKLGGRSGSHGSRSRVRGLLAVTQVAFSVVLLLSSALLLRSFLHLVAVNPGFQTAHALRFGIGLPEKRYDSEQKLIDFHRKLLERLAAIPGVLQTGAAGQFPLTSSREASFQIAGAGIPSSQRPRASISPVSPGYFAAMAIPLLEGRDFSWRDDRSKGQYVAIVNQTFARTYLRDHGRVGTVLDAAGTDWTIVGVVADTRQASMDREPLPEIFLSLSQTGADGAIYVVRTRGDEIPLAKTVIATVAEQDPRLERVNPRPLRLTVEQNLASRKNAVQLVAGFGTLALLLTAMGIYGIVAFRAQERSPEMAIRAALGATPLDIRRLVFGHGARIASAGVAIGVPLFFAVSPLLRRQLYGVGLADPLSLGVVVLLVLGIALAASLLPACRASETAPADVLKDS